MTQKLTRMAPEIERLVERQLRNWEISRAQRAASEETEKPVRDFVAISRQVASGGSGIATLLSEQTGWPVFDRELLQAMAQDDKIRERLYESLDERDVGWLGRTFELIIHGKYPPHDYFSRLTKTVLTLARGGEAVFLGRGADLVLPREQGLRVRVVAPLEQRVRSFAGRHKLDVEQAREQVEQIDRQRAEFIRAHFHVEIDDPTRCDLVLNLGRLTPEDAVAAIMATLRSRKMVT